MSLRKKILEFEGLCAPPVTPMHDDGSVNYGAIPAYVDHLIHIGVKGVFVLGTTGEFTSLSLAERKMVAEAWIKHGKGKFDIILIQCGSTAITDVKELIKHAEEIGADGVGCIAPSFLRAQNDGVLTDYLHDVAMAAPNMPFLYYHIPPLTNVNVNMLFFLESCQEKIPMFSGIKISSFTMFEATVALQFPQIKLFYGQDWQLLGAFAMGANAGIGTSMNFVAKELNEMIAAFSENNLEKARKIQARLSLDLGPMFDKYHGVAFAKAALKFLSGIDMGQPRLPLHQFTEKEFQEIKDYLRNKNYDVKDDV